jgi:antitoxin MazE
VKVRILQIGNSKGILLNKSIRDRYGLANSIDLVMKEDHVEIWPASPPRLGWDEAFREMHERGDDTLIGDDLLDENLLEDWEWK